MHRINRLNRPVLITPDEVIFHLASDDDTGVRMILNSIINAEERIIAPAICDELYYSFIEKKNVLVTSANQADVLHQMNDSRALEGKPALPPTAIKPGMYINGIEFLDETDDAELILLWNMFLWKLTAEAVDLMCTVPTWLRHTASGQQKNNPEVIGGSAGGSVTGDYKDVKFKMDNQLQDRIDPLVTRMHSWICTKRKENSDFLPLYCKKCDCDSDGVAINRKTDWIFGDDSKEGCDDCMNEILKDL